MRTNLIKKLGFSAMLMLAFLAAKATDGYFSVGYGTINKGLAGAGVAYYQGSLINGNPAGAVFLGKKFQFGVDLFNPNRKFTISGNPSGMDGTFGLMPGTVESESKLFVIPSFGANWMLGEKSSLSVSAFGNGGMNTDYPVAGFYDQSSTSLGVNLAQLFGNLTYAVKLGENHSLGVTGVLAYQYFEAKGLAAFGMFSSAPEKVSGNGNDNSFGVGFKLGYLGKIADNFTIGGVYQSKVYMSELEEYAGLFAEQGDFDIPASWSAGFSWDVTDAFTVMADVKQIFYGDVKSIANPMLPNMMEAQLGMDGGAGFGWDDVTVFKFGVSCSAVERWIFRAGYSIGDNPIPESEVMFNILAPGVITNQLAFGFSKEVGNKGNQFHLALNYAMNNQVEGPNPLDPPAGQTIEIEMNQLELELGFSF